MTYRERRLAKAARLRDWADKRFAKSKHAVEAAHALASAIPLGQPILVGHHSEKRHRAHIQRMDNAMRSSVENHDKATSMVSKADDEEISTHQ